MSDIERIIIRLQNLEPYAKEFPSINVNSDLILDTLEVLRDAKPAVDFRDMISGEIHETAKMFRKGNEET